MITIEHYYTYNLDNNSVHISVIHGKGYQAETLISFDNTNFITGPFTDYKLGEGYELVDQRLTVKTTVEISGGDGQTNVVLNLNGGRTAETFTLKTIALEDNDTIQFIAHIDFLA